MFKCLEMNQDVRYSNIKIVYLQNVCVFYRKINGEIS